MRLSDRQAAALIALADLGMPVSSGGLAETMTACGREGCTPRTGRHDGDALVLKGLAIKRHGLYEITGAGLLATVAVRGARQ